MLRILSNRAAVLLLCVFIGANFVAATFLTWLPTFIYEKFGDEPLGLLDDLGRLVALQPGRARSAAGFLADWAARTARGGGSGCRAWA